MTLAAPLQLTGKPEIMILQPALFIYLEKIGPFITHAPRAWKEFWQLAGGKIDPESIAAMAGLSRIDASKQGDDAFIYQAGITVKQAPETVPAGLQCRKLEKGKYARFLLTGSYSQLPAAYPAIFKIIDNEKLPVRAEDFCIERYLNDPTNTPEDQLKTEILIPVV